VNVRAQKPPTSIFGLRLRQARLEAGIPQDKLGVAIGLDETTASTRISRYETGIHAAPYETAAKIAQALHVPTPFLFCDDDDLARLILLWAGLSKSQRRKLLTELAVV
jgi:transcriptional regulator with XRE-family HTH domain